MLLTVVIDPSVAHLVKSESRSLVWMVDPSKSLMFEKQKQALQRTLGVQFMEAVGRGGILLYRMKGAGPGEELNPNETPQQLGLKGSDSILVRIAHAPPPPPQAPSEPYEDEVDFDTYDANEEQAVKGLLQNLTIDQVKKLNHLATFMNELSDEQVSRILSGDFGCECPQCGHYCTLKDMGTGEPPVPLLHDPPDPRHRKHHHHQQPYDGGSQSTYDRREQVGGHHGREEAKSRGRRSRGSRSSRPMSYRSRQYGGRGDESPGFWQQFVSEWGKQTDRIGTDDLMYNTCPSSLARMARRQDEGFASYDPIPEVMELSSSRWSDTRSRQSHRSFI